MGAFVEVFGQFRSLASLADLGILLPSPNCIFILLWCSQSSASVISSGNPL
jgi:hypothetical protein